MSELHISPPVGEDSRRRRLTLLAGLMIGVLALTATACAKHGKSTADPKASQGLSNVDASSTPDTGGGSGGTSTSPSTKPTSHSGSNSGPQIVVFKVTQQPLCGIEGTVDAPFHQDPKPIVLFWQITGATGVDLYLNGGLYGRYGPTGTQELAFACNDKPTSTNVYKLVTSGGSGQPVSRTLTVTANNNPPT